MADSSKKKPAKKNGGKKKDEPADLPEPAIKRVKYDSRAETYKHIQAVQANVLLFVQKMMERAVKHDASKLEEPEKEYFDKYTPILEELEYGSDEYEQSLKAIDPALQAHYAKNDHHPEHYPNGVNGMTLMALVEMFCDWKAATERQNDGNLRKSLEHNREKYGLSDQIYEIFENTMKELGW